MMGFMMRSSKGLALAFVSGALLVGGVLGFTANRVMERSEDCAVSATRAAMRERLADDLGLSSAQRAKLDTILDAKRASMQAALEPVRPAMRAIGDTAALRIEGMLDAAQRAKFAAMRAAHEKREHESQGKGERFD